VIRELGEFAGILHGIADQYNWPEFRECHNRYFSIAEQLTPIREDLNSSR